MTFQRLQMTPNESNVTGSFVFRTKAATVFCLHVKPKSAVPSRYVL